MSNPVYTISASSWHGEQFDIPERVLRVRSEDGLHRAYRKAQKQVCGMKFCQCTSTVSIRKTIGLKTWVLTGFWNMPNMPRLNSPEWQELSA